MQAHDVAGGGAQDGNLVMPILQCPGIAAVDRGAIAIGHGKDAVIQRGDRTVADHRGDVVERHLAAPAPPI